MKVKEMDKDLRPREKAFTYGLDSLSDLEIVALLLQSGNRDRSVFDMAQDVLRKTENLTKLFDIRLEDLMDIKGIKQVKALQIVSGIELARRALKERNYTSSVLRPEDLVKWFHVEIGIKTQEHFVVVYLNNKGKIVLHKILFIGTLTESCVHPRDIFYEAYRNKAHSLIMAHNHPSGDVTPSYEDIQFTLRIQEVSILQGFQLLDHIIVGKENWFSFKQQGYLD